LRREAVRIINARVCSFSQTLGVTFHRVTVRDQNTRWGSCSRLKNLSFNWRIIMAPEPVLDYVVIHELCHLQELNHSPRFWALVARHAPEWRVHRRWLNKFGDGLRASL
jgi:predicted metal-dependent hydrolase